MINNVDKIKLGVESYRANTSNIMNVIGKYLPRK